MPSLIRIPLSLEPPFPLFLLSSAPDGGYYRVLRQREGGIAKRSQLYVSCF